MKKYFSYCVGANGVQYYGCTNRDNCEIGSRCGEGRLDNLISVECEKNRTIVVEEQDIGEFVVKRTISLNYTLNEIGFENIIVK